MSNRANKLFHPLAGAIGWRYLHAKRRNQFISFISFSSMGGVALGVLALIVILSVMNGFEKELRERILGMTAHVLIESADNDALADWQNLSAMVARHPQVLGSAPALHAEAMITHGGLVNGVVVRGVLPEAEDKVSSVNDKMRAGSLNDLRAGEFGMVLGIGLARSLRAGIGDKITLISPQPNATPAGVLPRSKRFTVVGIFEVGSQEYDSMLAYTHAQDAGRLFRVSGGVNQLRIKLRDALHADEVAGELRAQMQPQQLVTAWTQQHSSFFGALKTEKIMMSFILTLIIAVAAFNIVASLVMVVTDKRTDIAVLRTLGMNAAGIMRVFITQGFLIGVIGVLAGGCGGVLLALNLPDIMLWLEQTFGFRLFDPTVYYITALPSDLQVQDVIIILSVAFVLCLLATLYPAWRAAQTHPAEALRYE